LVRGTGTSLMACDLRLEIVVVGFFRQPGKRLGPCRLVDEKPVRVVGTGELANLTSTEEVWESRFEGFQVLPYPRTYHDVIRIDGLAVLAIALSGAHGAEEAVFCENPHTLLPSLDFGNHSHRFSQDATDRLLVVEAGAEDPFRKRPGQCLRELELLD